MHLLSTFSTCWIVQSSFNSSTMRPITSLARAGAVFTVTNVNGPLGAMAKRMRLYTLIITGSWYQRGVLGAPFIVGILVITRGPRGDNRSGIYRWGARLWGTEDYVMVHLN